MRVSDFMTWSLVYTKTEMPTLLRRNMGITLQMEDTKEAREEQEVMILKERRPSLLSPEVVVVEVRKKGSSRNGILTILGGFIVCLSFGSGMV